MKSLILILLVGVGAQAQTIADIARQERAKQARSQTPAARVITNEDLKRSRISAATGAQAAPQAVEGAEKPSTPATEPAKPAEPTKPAATQPDPVEAWNAEIAALRTKIRELQDKETATQLQINHQANKVYAPVTTVRERNEAQAALGAEQKNLVTIREDIIATRLKLEQLQARGPARN